MVQLLPDEWPPGYHTVDACSDADPIHPDAFKPFPSRMKAFYGATIVACTLAGACAPAATPPEIPQPTPVPATPPFRMDSTLTAGKAPAPQKTRPLALGSVPAAI